MLDKDRFVQADISKYNLKDYKHLKKLKEKSNPDELWERYQKNKSIENRNLLIEHYLHILQDPVKEVYPTCKNNHELEDIFQSAVIGLIEAIEYYSPDKNASFKTFSRWRIHGSIIDYLRKTGFISLPYNVRKKINTEREKAESENLHTTFQNPYTVHSLDVMTENSENKDFVYTLIDDLETETENIVLDKMEKEELYKALKKIPVDEYITLVHYYFKEKTLDDIAKILNMTRAGVWHVRNRGLGHMKTLLNCNR